LAARSVNQARQPNRTARKRAKENTVFKIIFTFLAFIVVALFLSFLMAYPTMWVWNYVAPPVVGLKTVTVCQAWALNALCALLFKSYESTGK
jgi:hypothetical protein